ncbi:hypothetical protein ACFB49_04400 [Sphingomonas sp. DBB INV C78]|uniref:NF038122 family metalloprotease n=1 Tax=Sphingomonas sp. DBB INV C78 TaxID=3349434 RepID=UPI0036D2C605
MKVAKLLAGAALAFTALAATPASAVKINLNYTGAGSPNDDAAYQGFVAAANFWETILTNNSTVNLNVSYAVLPPNVLGSTGSTRADVFLKDVTSALQSRANSALDATASASAAAEVNGAGAVSAITHTPLQGSLGVQTGNREWDNDNSENNSYIWGNTANLKALGITKDYLGNDISNVVDGTVRFSTEFKFDFNPTDGIDADAIDFVGVAVHEIGHALGFVSGVDLYDQYGFPNGPSWQQGGFDFDNPGGGLMSVLDLFRYSSDPSGLAPGGDAVLDWSVANAAYIAAGGNPFFSIDGGANQLFGDSRFSTGRYNGDGRQASHWKDNLPGVPQIGVMDPTVAYGHQDIVEGLDLAAFDAIGYDIAYDVLIHGQKSFSSAVMPGFSLSSIPEPTTWAQMVLGFGFLGGAFRRARRETAGTATA